MKPKVIEKKPLEKYSVAPYNFVSFPAKAQIRYRDCFELPKHNTFKDMDGEKLLNGYITYRLKAETPIIVSSGTDPNTKQAAFFNNSSGEYAIPGNTIRGMIRTNAQILSHSSIVGNRNEKGEYKGSDIEDSTFLFRDVAGGNSLNKKYSTLLGIHALKRIAQNVKAGYMVNKGGKLYIEPAVELIEGRTYLRIDEIELRKKLGDKKLPGVYFMYNEDLLKKVDEIKELNKEIAELKNNHKYDKIRALENEKNKILSDKENDKRSANPYKAYHARISFEYDNKRGKVTQIGMPGIYKNDGYILSGGPIRGKLSHYVVPKAKEDEKAIDISEIQKERYFDDLVLTKKADKTPEGVKTKKGNEFWELPKSESKKPVFYINVNNELHFGFTPYLRLFYDKSVLDGIDLGYKDVQGISYAEGLFGFSNKEGRGKEEKVSYKSRVGFEDAVVLGKAEIDMDSSIKMLLAEPKPTSYNLYLVQKDEDKKQLSIYDGNFRLRGIKQYWLKEYIEQPEVKSENMFFNIKPLKEGTCFEGRIYFNNLYEDELGLLLWSLKLDDGCYQNIGLAKPYGFGRVKAYDIELQVEDLDKKYESFCFDYMIKKDVDEYINTYKEYFSKDKLYGKAIDQEVPIKELMFIKSKIVKFEEANSFRYMEIKPEYGINRQTRGKNEFAVKKVLPNISYFIGEPASNNNQIKPQNPTVQKQRPKDNNKSKQNSPGRLTHTPFKMLKDFQFED